MFKTKLLVPLILCLAISIKAFMVAGCDTAEEEADDIDPEEEVEVVDEIEEEKVDDKKEEINDDLVLMLPPTAGNLAASPGGDYLLFTMAAAPIDPYFIINTETYEGEICDDRGVYWGDIEGLPTPGFEHGVQVDAPHFSPDGEKLLYVGYEVYAYDRVNAAIYLCELGLPPEVFQQVDLSSDELIEGIKPAWKADQEGIYYLTAKGVMSYSSEEEQAEKIYPARELNGLVQEDKLAPHAFFAKDDHAWLAYYHEGKINLVTLENDDLVLEVFDTGLSDINNIEFLFDGRYIAMESYYMYDIEGYFLEFLDLQKGVLAELESDYLPAGYSKNDQEEMAFIKVNEQNDLTFTILNSSLEEVQKADAPSLIRDVIWLDGRWCVLGSNQEGYPLYKVGFE